MAKCEVCFRHCEIKDGSLGFCGGRSCIDGKVIPVNYGRVTSLALDPIEKKPLNRFHPGSKIISVGSFGCNLRCPFCQNDEISWSGQALSYAGYALEEMCGKETDAAGSARSENDRTEYVSPEELTETAKYYRDRGNIGVAFTYNEPLIGYEYVLDTAKLVHEAGMVNVLVTNGTAELPILEKLLPYVDAMNIDLKGFSQDYYNRTLGGNLEMTKQFIERAVKDCHVELTTLIVPEENDTEEEMRAICEWISSLRDKNGDVVGESIPLHISRFFPRYKMTDRAATDVGHIYHLADIARDSLKYVYTGNC